MAADGYIRVRVTARAGRGAVCIEKDPRHPVDEDSGKREVAVKRVGTEHTVGQTPRILAALERGELALVSEPRVDEDELPGLEIPQGVWRSAGLEPIEGAQVLEDLPRSILRKIAGAGGRSKVQREFIAAAKQALEQEPEADADGQPDAD